MDEWSNVLTPMCDILFIPIGDTTIQFMRVAPPVA